MNTETNATNEVAIINNSIEVFKTAPEVLNENRGLTEKALAVGAKIIDDWEKAFLIEDEDERMAALATLEERSNNYMLNCAKALERQKAARSPITQLMDMFRGKFTEIENAIDKTKDFARPAVVQLFRNKFATLAKQIEQRKQQEAALKANREREIIDLNANIEKAVFNKFNDYVAERKSALLSSFNSITLDTYDEKKKKLEEYQPALKSEIILNFPINVYGKFHSQAEIGVMCEKKKQEECKQYVASYAAEMTSYRDELIEMLPSKLAELTEEKRLADEREKLRLAAENEKNAKAKKLLEQQQKEKEDAQELLNKQKLEREQAATNKIGQEAAELAQASDFNIAANKQSAETMVMFQETAEVAAIAPEIKIKEAYEITVLHPVGFTQIFALWFEHEGKGLAIDKLGNTKLDQMKAWCEKKASADKPIKIESQFLKYEIVHKAANRKTAK